jgi:hypothetical protein
MNLKGKLKVRLCSTIWIDATLCAAGII